MSRKLTDWISSFLEYTDNSEPKVIFRKWVALSVVASALQRKCYLEWEDRKYPNMYVVLVGPPASRKGTAMAPGMRLLRDLGIPMAAESITKEALSRDLRDSAYQEVEGIGADGEASYSKVTFHCSLTVYSKEFTVFLGYNNPELMAWMSDWYDCADKWIYRTKGQGTDEILGVFVNLIGATTPELIRLMMPLETIGGGLASRIIFVYAEDKERPISRPFKTEAQRRLGDQIEIDLEHIHNMRGEFSLTPEALAFWDTWYIERGNKSTIEDPKFSGYTERRGSHVLKMCMILSASQGDDMMITPNILRRAVSTIEEAELFMPRVFRGVGRSDIVAVTARVEDVLLARKEITLAELQRMFYMDADRDTLLRVIDTLQTMGFCQRVEHRNKTMVKLLEG